MVLVAEMHSTLAGVFVVRGMKSLIAGNGVKSLIAGNDFCRTKLSQLEASTEITRRM